MPAADDTIIDGTAETRLLGQHMVGRFETLAQASSDQLVKTSGWLTASLLAINGGGALAALNAVDRVHSASSAGWFGAGLLMAMVSGVAIQGIQAKIAAPVEQYLFFWRRVSENGQLDQGALEQHQRDLHKFERLRFIPPLAGWISAALFAAGGLTLAEDLSQRDEGAQARCMSLQNDMLASSPRRSDSRDLFVALGCKAAGNGRVHVRSAGHQI